MCVLLNTISIKSVVVFVYCCGFFLYVCALSALWVVVE